MRRSDAAARDDEVVCSAQAAGGLGDGVGIVGDGLDALEGLAGGLVYAYMRDGG